MWRAIVVGGACGTFLVACGGGTNDTEDGGDDVVDASMQDAGIQDAAMTDNGDGGPTVDGGPVDGGPVDSGPTVDGGPSFFALGGSVSGLDGTLILRNGSEDKQITADGAFAFDTQLEDLSAYTVSIVAMPDSQVCTLSNATGMISGAAVTNVSVTCADHTHSCAYSLLAGSPGTIEVDSITELAVTANIAGLTTTVTSDGSANAAVTRAQFEFQHAISCGRNLFVLSDTHLIMYRSAPNGALQWAWSTPFASGRGLACRSDGALYAIRAASMTYEVDVLSFTGAADADETPVAADEDTFSVGAIAYPVYEDFFSVVVHPVSGSLWILTSYSDGGIDRRSYGTVIGTTAGTGIFGLADAPAYLIVDYIGSFCLQPDGGRMLVTSYSGGSTAYYDLTGAPDDFPTAVTDTESTGNGQECVWLSSGYAYDVWGSNVRVRSMTGAMGNLDTTIAASDTQSERIAANENASVLVVSHGDGDLDAWRISGTSLTDRSTVDRTSSLADMALIGCTPD